MPLIKFKSIKNFLLKNKTNRVTQITRLKLAPFALLFFKKTNLKFITLIGVLTLSHCQKYNESVTVSSENLGGNTQPPPPTSTQVSNINWPSLSNSTPLMSANGYKLLNSKISYLSNTDDTLLNSSNSNYKLKTIK